MNSDRVAKIGRSKLNEQKNGGGSADAIFSGVDVLIKRLSELALVVTDIRVNGEITDVVAELHLLDASLQRLQTERSWVDVADVDSFISRLRST